MKIHKSIVITKDGVSRTSVVPSYYQLSDALADVFVLTPKSIYLNRILKDLIKDKHEKLKDGDHIEIFS